MFAEWGGGRYHDRLNTFDFPQSGTNVIDAQGIILLVLEPEPNPNYDFNSQPSESRYLSIASDIVARTCIAIWDLLCNQKQGMA